MIGLDDVHLTLPSAAGPTPILRGVTLNAPPGQALGIVGPSGSGKTSMLMVIAGLERASSGGIRIAGEDLTGMSEDALADFRRRNLGIVFQAFHLIPTMTALENVATPLEFAGRDDAFDRAREQLAAVGLDHRLEHYPGQLSGGEQQRVALARAFAGEPPLLMADEPTGNLDRANGEHVIDLLFDLRVRHNATLMLITHDRALANRCDRIVALSDGAVAEDSAAARAEATQ